LKRRERRGIDEASCPAFVSSRDLDARFWIKFLARFPHGWIARFGLAVVPKIDYNLQL